MTDPPERSCSSATSSSAIGASLASSTRGHGAQPGHVRGRGRRGAHDADLDRPGLRRSPPGGGGDPAWFTFTVAIWLWLTVLFGNFAEAIAEGRGKAQADALRAMRTQTVARLRDGGEKPAQRAAARRRRRRRRPAR